MQPYFFPYLGYFSLIEHSDVFILLDEVQYIRHGWIERNRILNMPEGWVYFRVPILKMNGSKSLIREVVIDNTTNWQQRILSQLVVYKRIGEYYQEVLRLLEHIFDLPFESIVDLNYNILEVICKYLKINTPIHVFSSMNLTIEPPNEPDEWALNICRELNPKVEDYWNPPGGMSFFHPEKFIANNIRLAFFEYLPKVYPQKNHQFEPLLSVIDALMFLNPSEISPHLDSFRLIHPGSEPIRQSCENE
jgi:hypothetical protein